MLKKIYKIVAVCVLCVLLFVTYCAAEYKTHSCACHSEGCIKCDTRENLSKTGAFINPIQSFLLRLRVLKQNLVTIIEPLTIQRLTPISSKVRIDS